MELNDLLTLCEFYLSMGSTIQLGAKSLANGARIEDQHRDALPILAKFFTMANDFIDTDEADDIVDIIRMFLFDPDSPTPRMVGPYD